MFTGFAQVASAAWKKRHSAINSDSDGLYHHMGSKKLIAPTQKLGSLNKACIITNPEKELDFDGKSKEEWKLKALIKVLPIRSIGIIIGVTISQYSFLCSKPAQWTGTFSDRGSKSQQVP
ncbi:hypothetical protein Ddye_020834 [Dipteronia dyeriana]|uniref:Uncharacterized protein n=1 Tax=Dipteronia dyeriana TaxID=168575 RepID=A0AAD9U0G5_9ROSI|nr:hypothetical protein Ddye_020834 [Dipteronia dyeriana]